MSLKKWENVNPDISRVVSLSNMTIVTYRGKTLRIPRSFFPKKIGNGIMIP